MPKLCEYQNCFNRASYGFNKLERCNIHKEDRKYIDKRICQCGKAQPSFNLPGEKKAICCFSCKTDDMVDVIHKKCLCGKSQPVFNLPGEKKAICCSLCKTDDMVDIKNPKCPNCIDWIDAKHGNNKYKGYCIRCYEQLFPNDPLTFQIRSKTKEIAVRDFINTNYEGFQHDKSLYTGHCNCTIRRRIDHRKLINNTLLCIETDENQHKSYDQMDEEMRYDDLYMAYSGKWIYIRFNPDKYNNKKNEKKNPEIATRLRVLKNVLDTQIERINNEENTELVEIIYLYYDKYN